jgi:hypothetical protein
MPLETAKSTGFFSFGTGIVVGLGAAFAMRATAPRATEFVGLVLQKMGFELGDMLLALWDPEANQQTAALNAPASMLPAGKRKRASAGNRDNGVAKALRNGEERALKLPRIGRTGLRSRGNAPKLSSTRRGGKSRMALGLT